jgi:hypothetical protein
MAQVNLATAQTTKEVEVRSGLKKRGYQILELYYDSYSDRKRDQLYNKSRASLTKLAY